LEHVARVEQSTILSCHLQQCIGDLSSSYMREQVYEQSLTKHPGNVLQGFFNSKQLRTSPLRERPTRDVTHGIRCLLSTPKLPSANQMDAIISYEYELQWIYSPPAVKMLSTAIFEMQIQNSEANTVLSIIIIQNTKIQT
jgi:hypothetical protein